MDERLFLDVVSGRKTSLSAKMMRAVLWLVAPAYRGVMAARNLLFDVGLKRAHRSDVPVISVGNITTGGTGKTPVVAWMANWLQSRGMKVCLVSRGYRELQAGGNDELRVLEQLCPGVPHVQNRDRVAAAKEAVERHHADVIVLDDGFQHRRLHRDVDIVLLDATNPWGYGHLLPRGLMREPRSSLRRASIVVLTRVDQVDEQALQKLRNEVRQATNAPVAEVAFRPTQLRSITGATADVKSFANEKLLAFCGIGNPEGFRRTLRDSGIHVSDDAFVTFADHHHYTQSELMSLVDRARAEGVSAMVTTQKDLVKLDPAWTCTLPIWAVIIGAEVVTGLEALESVLQEIADPKNARDPIANDRAS